MGLRELPGFGRLDLFGIPWILSVRNEPFQWVTRDPRPIFNSCGPFPRSGRRRPGRPSIPKVDRAEPLVPSRNRRARRDHGNRDRKGRTEHWDQTNAVFAFWQEIVDSAHNSYEIPAPAVAVREAPDFIAALRWTPDFGLAPIRGRDWRPRPPNPSATAPIRRLRHKDDDISANASRQSNAWPACYSAATSLGSSSATESDGPAGSSHARVKGLSCATRTDTPPSRPAQSCGSRTRLAVGPSPQMAAVIFDMIDASRRRSSSIAIRRGSPPSLPLKASPSSITPEDAPVHGADRRRQEGARDQPHVPGACREQERRRAVPTTGRTIRPSTSSRRSAIAPPASSPALRPAREGAGGRSRARSPGHDRPAEVGVVSVASLKHGGKQAAELFEGAAIAHRQIAFRRQVVGDENVVAFELDVPVGDFVRPRPGRLSRRSRDSRPGSRPRPRGRRRPNGRPRDRDPCDGRSGPKALAAIANR